MSEPTESAPSTPPADLPDPIEYGPDTIEGRAIELMKAQGISFYIGRDGFPSYPNKDSCLAIIEGLKLADKEKGGRSIAESYLDTERQRVATAKARIDHLENALRVAVSRLDKVREDGNTEHLESAEACRQVLDGKTWGEAALRSLHLGSLPRY